MNHQYACLALVLLLAVVAGKADDNESCYSFAGGSVYPAGEPKGDHQLQYTKAVSKWEFSNLNYDLKLILFSSCSFKTSASIRRHRCGEQGNSPTLPLPVLGQICRAALLSFRLVSSIVCYVLQTPVTSSPIFLQHLCLSHRDYCILRSHC